jgi:hypothetical protein
VTWTSLTAAESGGTKKSAALVAVPAGVRTEIRPDVASAGTAVEIDVLVAELTRAYRLLSVTQSLEIVVS